MADETGTDKAGFKTATVFTIVLHSVLPLSWLGFSLYVAPLFVDSFSELAGKVPESAEYFLRITEGISESVVRFVLVFACALLADGLVYLGLVRSGRRQLAGLWSAIIVMCEIAVTAGFIAVLYLSMLKVSSF